MQDTGIDLFEIADTSDKDRCLENFFAAAVMLDKELEGFWCDYIDPSSGLPMKTETNQCFSDIDACSRLLKLGYVQCGGCVVMEHPIYGFCFYPSTFFTVAPRHVVLEKLEKVKQSLNDTWTGTGRV